LGSLQIESLQVETLNFIKKTRMKSIKTEIKENPKNTITILM